MDILDYPCEINVIINPYFRDSIVSIWPIRYNWHRLAQGVRSPTLHPVWRVTTWSRVASAARVREGR